MLKQKKNLKLETKGALLGKYDLILSSQKFLEHERLYFTNLPKRKNWALKRKYVRKIKAAVRHSVGAYSKKYRSYLSYFLKAKKTYTVFFCYHTLCVEQCFFYCVSKNT